MCWDFWAKTCLHRGKMYNNIDGMLNDVPPRGRWYLETFMVATVVIKRKNNYNYTYIYIILYICPI